MTPCTHRKPERWEWHDVIVDPWGGTEPRMVQVGGQSTDEDMDIGRFRCTQCGRIGYYTGHWRDFFEMGIPCPGSDRIKREP